ncbi:PREDICTED: kanadaptin [Ceratosolen solmsi marchali]|uniref:Kanadaptin n=1 Tax=Ceratosolen solmsi marchali TaxID=326594 RepID=A0AAJ6YQT4_9HYME|nr:PREDICTED: kanadaptin [Ceratosolen solmsi marchali]
MDICTTKQENNKKKIDSLELQIHPTEFVKEIVMSCNETNSKFCENQDNHVEISTNHFDKDTFKKPVIIGPRKGYPIKLKTLSDNILNKVFQPKEQQSNTKINNIKINSTKKPDNFKCPLKVQKEKELSLLYKEPLWSGKLQETYKLEVLKSGIILETIDLSEKNYYVIGRLPACDISMAHPTISRYHAILQFRIADDETNRKGIYLYDLASTHGTFWNGNRIKPKFYVHVQGGHILQFGCSQRKFIIQAPLDDQQEESEYSLTELKEKKILKQKDTLENKQLLEEVVNESVNKEDVAEGINWGMSEDADEETDLTENPYAQTNNEELFMYDPKKSLRGWFEREGFDLNYQTEEKGIGRFLCYVDIPIDPYLQRTIRAEALVIGKKKEAIVQCALEACRILDRYGLLRQANHENRKKKSRNWEEVDYYDSDEDNFLDRTGIIEKKRERRMRLAGKLVSKVETYNSLFQKHSTVVKKIESLKNAISLQKIKQNEICNSNVDALDAYMSILESTSYNKTEIKKMKMELQNLRKEEMQLLKLINLTKPANLPLLKPRVLNMINKSKHDFKTLKSTIDQQTNYKFSEKKLKTASKQLFQDHNISKHENLKNLNKVKDLEKFQENETIKFEINIQDFCLQNINTEFVKLPKISINQDLEENTEIEKINLKKKNVYTKQYHQRTENSNLYLDDYNKTKFREDYSMWLPPENQCGDGKTILNEKFGY